jgi:hypothetical protein
VVVAERSTRPGEPFHALARLPAKIYVTASPETTLVKTLRTAGRKPEVLECCWRPGDDEVPMEPRPTRPPKPEAPLVYHVFGVLHKPSTLVLTEDDYFDFLIATSTYKLIPREVRGALTDSGLLFLGFRLDDWSFRALFRMIMNLEGVAGIRRYAHVGVQVDPEDHSLADVERARAYLAHYFSSDRGKGLAEPTISLFWGTPADFLAELELQMSRLAEQAAPAASEVDAYS